ncbi:hypothetical protein BBBOND_0205880 [Babesia bigemina]|uniref:Uncharacterized protein n=1 Tax=Babesia bigemina TaxID=5866 RepID=A0A061DCA3_BABBI|nr:hypothetical protein BBBOND_0205880 [Babesia bigemina]CDR95430.1 hypothetical protein BBBOND_0205880 [Babesia bigemina]|eukprot:XP_012767616.1 hypothetical protein BBBOND_0205880 [Babesia bigemina]
MVYTSLTDAPHNFKEAADWLLALKGDDVKNLKAIGEAVYKFLVDKPVGRINLPALEKVKRISKHFLEQRELRNYWFVEELLKRYNDLISKSPGAWAKYFRVVDESDYKNVVKSKGITAEDIAKNLDRIVNGTEILRDSIKIPDEYQSAYSSEATWESSCAKDPEACATVFVGIAPMLYAGVRSLHTASIAATLNLAPLTRHEYGLRKTMKALGYVEPECRTNMSGLDVGRALRGLYLRRVLTLCDLAGFWAFYGSKNAAVKSGELDKDAQEFIDFYVNMKPINPPKKYVLRKPPSTYTATGSNNMYYPWLPTVLDMGDTVPL